MYKAKIESLAKLLDVISSLTFKDVLIICLLSTIGLLTFYTYKQIEKTGEVIEAVYLSGPSSFLKEFGMEDLESELLVKRYLDRIKYETRAQHVSLWGYHNGLRIGPIPFRRQSMIDESVSSGGRPLYQNYQNIPLNVYLDYTQRLWESESGILISLELAEEKYFSIYYDMVMDGYYASFNIPIYIKGYRSPIGFIRIYFSEERYREIKQSRERERIPEITSGLVSGMQAVFNQQYVKTLDN